MHTHFPARVRSFALPWWPGKSRIEAEANCLFTGSNAPSHDCEGYCLSQSLGYAS